MVSNFIEDWWISLWDFYIFSTVNSVWKDYWVIKIWSASTKYEVNSSHNTVIFLQNKTFLSTITSKIISHCSPLLDIGISKCRTLQLIFSYSHPAPAISKIGCMKKILILFLVYTILLVICFCNEGGKYNDSFFFALLFINYL